MVHGYKGRLVLALGSKHQERVKRLGASWGGRLARPLPACPSCSEIRGESLEKGAHTIWESHPLQLEVPWLLSSSLG